MENEDGVQKFRGMIHNTNATLIAQKMQGINFPQVIETFPLWVGQMRHLGEFLPFEPNLFDLVIVDEASQVNIAVGNEMMMADLAYYNSTGDAAKRGKTSAGDIHNDLSTRYPGRSSAKTPQPAAK